MKTTIQILQNARGLYDTSDRFSLATALYWYVSDYHNGKSSPEYSVLSRLSKDYRPARSETSENFREDDEFAGFLYDEFVRLQKEFDCEEVYQYLECEENWED
jgi:hypothetical protein